MARNKTPAYLEPIRVFLEKQVPDDVEYIFICQRPSTETSPSVITTVEGSRAHLGHVLRNVAAGLEGDA